VAKHYFPVAKHFVSLLYKPDIELLKFSGGKTLPYLVQVPKHLLRNKRENIYFWQNIMFQTILPGRAVATGSGNEQLAGSKTSYFNTAL
jgi:hypothetical protein